jgi:hypothetical protein
VEDLLCMVTKIGKRPKIVFARGIKAKSVR